MACTPVEGRPQDVVIKLDAGTAAGNAEVLTTLRTFLEQIREAAHRETLERIALVLDVSALPLLLDPSLLVAIIDLVGSYRAYFGIVASMRVLTAPGLQLALASAALSAIHFSMPTSAEAA